jgi:hypothetical protein
MENHMAPALSTMADSAAGVPIIRRSRAGELWQDCLIHRAMPGCSPGGQEENQKPLGAERKAVRRRQ